MRVMMRLNEVLFSMRVNGTSRRSGDICILLNQYGKAGTDYVCEKSD